MITGTKLAAAIKLGGYGSEHEQGMKLWAPNMKRKNIEGRAPGIYISLLSSATQSTIPCILSITISYIHGNSFHQRTLYIQLVSDSYPRQINPPTIVLTSYALSTPPRKCIADSDSIYEPRRYEY